MINTVENFETNFHYTVKYKINNNLQDVKYKISSNYDTKLTATAVCHEKPIVNQAGSISHPHSYHLQIK